MTVMEHGKLPMAPASAKCPVFLLDGPVAHGKEAENRGHLVYDNLHL